MNMGITKDVIQREQGNEHRGTNIERTYRRHKEREKHKKHKKGNTKLNTYSSCEFLGVSCLVERPVLHVRNGVKVHLLFGLRF